MFVKITALMVLLAVTWAFPSDHYPPVHKDVYQKPYSFGYGVNDDYKGLNFGQNEESDGKVVKGSYTVQLPDGRKQTVTYKADHYNGFHADVSYYGEAQYPSHAEYPPFVVKPSSYHPKPPKYH